MSAYFSWVFKTDKFRKTSSSDYFNIKMQLYHACDRVLQVIPFCHITLNIPDIHKKSLFYKGTNYLYAYIKNCFVEIEKKIKTSK